ncbi:hypothetical protein IIV6-T1_020 [Invertebrate iridescent virus 6]|nr:hypothetical protein IIV6-T1_020 [Invertebrate iridescent virus 6]
MNKLSYHKHFPLEKKNFHNHIPPEQNYELYHSYQLIIHQYTDYCHVYQYILYFRYGWFLTI